MQTIYLALLHSLGFSQKKLAEIFSHTENYQDVFEALSTESLKKYRFDEKQIEKILKNKESLHFEDMENKLKKREVNIITFHEKEYPESLKNIANPPFLLYLRGVIDSAPKLAVIGSRQITSYGQKIIENLIPNISKYFTIVSGGAFGCDSEAHIQTLKNKGKTIVVIGTGIDIDYPSDNKKLYDDIVLFGGAIVSIFPLSEPGNTYNFPIRNEIISGISSGVLVVEAGEKSGTLITALLALDQGRDLFAIPGDIYRVNSSGCNNLIKRGEAKVVTCAQDILEEYNLNTVSSLSPKIPHFTSVLEKHIYHKLILEPFSIDELSRDLQLSSTDISICISFLEIRSIVKKISNGKYEVC